MSPCPTNISPAERKQSAAARVQKWANKDDGLNNAPGDHREIAFESRTPPATLTTLGKKLVGVDPWPGLPFD